MPRARKSDKKRIEFSIGGWCIIAQSLLRAANSSKDHTAAVMASEIYSKLELPRAAAICEATAEKLETQFFKNGRH